MTFDRTALLERNLDRQIAWTRASDAKLALVLPINSAMLGVLAAQLAQAQATAGPHHWALALAASVPALVSFFSAVMAALPRTRTRTESCIHFTGVAEHAPERFHDRMRDLTEEEHFEHLAAEVHASARIAREKMIHARRAYYALFIALPFWVAAIYLLNSGQA